MSEVEESCLSMIENNKLPEVYKKRLKFEVSEIRKQGADTYWLNLIKDECKFDKNPNNLVLPWMLGMIDQDPVVNRKDPIITTSKYAKVAQFVAEHGGLPPEINRDSDNPDIDIDCLPEARDQIKDFAIKEYSTGIDDGYGAVCSVGTWMTYLLRSAIFDVAKSTQWCPESDARFLTKELPEEVDDLKDNGEAACKGCKYVHNDVECPKCKSPDTEYPTINQLLRDHKSLRDFNNIYPNVVDRAVRLVGRIRAMGKHAGALIIADRPLFGNIPMSLNVKTKQWQSLWTEGRNTQLSKFGYTKWDVLGLKNLRYIYEASRLIEQNHGISFGERTVAEYQFSPNHKVNAPSMSGWDDIDPDESRAGHYFTRDNEKIYIDLNDAGALKTASDSRTDAVFQFDTDLAKSTLSNGVTSFNDLMVLNAMGHPGPMAMIPDYVQRRGSPNGDWRHLDHPKITEILAETFNCIVFQEQLQALWQNVAGFTAPEAQEARKAVAKKWREKLRPVKDKWISGAGPVMGHDAAVAYWDKMETFGRYAFNKSHAVSYCLVAFRCLWLKTYFPHEWWAAVMSYCNADKQVRYMNVARGERVKFTPMDVNNLSMNFVAIPDEPRVYHTDDINGRVMPGLIGLKGIGAKVAQQFVDNIADWTPALSETEDLLEEVTDFTEGMSGESAQNLLDPLYDEIEQLEKNVVESKKSLAEFPVSSIDEFVQRKGKNKLLMERLIKLGSFQSFPGHENMKATWEWYRMNYCSGSDITALKKDMQAKWLASNGWNEDKIQEEKSRQIAEYQRVYPKRKKIPTKIENWKPKPEITLAWMSDLFKNDDYTLKEMLTFEIAFLGYHLHSAMDQFITKSGRTIEDAKQDGILECMISEPPHMTRTKTDKPMCKLAVSDGIQTAPVLLWEDDLGSIDQAILKKGVGMLLQVKYDTSRKNFSLQRGKKPMLLRRKPDKQEE